MKKQPPSGETVRPPGPLVNEPVSDTVMLTDALVDEPVTMINAFTVPPDESELFLHRWTDNVRIMATQPGFIRARMYRSRAEHAELGFVNVVQWASGNALFDARANPEWRAAMRRILDDPALHVIARPMVYDVALDIRPTTP